MLMQTGDLSKCLNLRIFFPGSSLPDLHRKSELIFLPGRLKICFLPSTSRYDTWSKDFWWSRRRLYQQRCYFGIPWGRCWKCSYHLFFNRAFRRWSSCSCQWFGRLARYYQTWWGAKLYLSWYRRDRKLYSIPSKVFIHQTLRIAPTLNQTGYR